MGNLEKIFCLESKKHATANKIYKMISKTKPMPSLVMINALVWVSLKALMIIARTQLLLTGMDLIALLTGIVAPLGATLVLRVAAPHQPAMMIGKIQ